MKRTTRWLVRGCAVWEVYKNFYVNVILSLERFRCADEMFIATMTQRMSVV